MAKFDDHRGSPVPAVDFYGETSAWPMSELVHSEPLVERSEMHDWRIRPHRHNELTQLFLVLEGRGRARLDSVWYDVAPPCLLLVPARVVHEFEWDNASAGFVLSISSGLISSLTQDMKPVATALQSSRVVDVSESREFMKELFAEIHNDCVDQRPMRDASLESLVRVLAIWLTRNADAQSPAAMSTDRARMHFARFTHAVNKHHKSHWSVAEYANTLGITPSHLNTVCRRLADKSALDVVHARLILAARRQLVYTEKNIAGIAYHLGFSDPSYFTRFFRRATGLTPAAFRRRSGTVNN